MKQFSLLLLSLLIFQINYSQLASVADIDFMQEYHEPYPVPGNYLEKEVRSIAIDDQSGVWIATLAGIFKKKDNDTAWSAMLPENDKGPSFAVATDNQMNVWAGTWKGAFLFKNNEAKLIDGTEGPISNLCASKEGMYALGPNGIWLYDGNTFIKKNYAIARSVRNVISDGAEGIWVATDVGLYHCNAKQILYYYKPYVLISAYIKGIAFDWQNKLWAGGLGGVSVFINGQRESVITPAEGCPSIYVNCIKKSPDGVMWIGTQAGVVRYTKDGKHSLRFSRRWLLDDNVKDIAFDKEGNAWIATSQGVSAIKKRKMNLASKEKYFYDVLMKRHIRAPWIAGSCHMRVPGDVSTCEPDDDDNDGEFTGNYLAMESFRYAATKNEEARTNAKKAFHFLKQLQEVTGGDGYFARSIIPVDWKYRKHDDNRKYTERELAEELVKEPRFKPVEERWRKSKDGKWFWKGDASSDEWCGHMFGYFFYYQLAADDAEKEIVRKHVALLVDHLIANNFNMMDIDGTHTRWAVWSPDNLNRDPEWMPDHSQNSMELLTFLKLAFYMTGNNKYQQQYLRLIKEEHYLDNMADVPNQNPAWFIYYDVTMQAYLYPVLLHCETDPQLLDVYKKDMEIWMAKRRNDKNPLINFLYCYATGRKDELAASVDFLTDTPLDLIDWNIDHTKRDDVKLVHSPVLDDLEIDQLPPASIRAAVRWDKNPWVANNGVPDMEREPVFWLLPYWMGRYLKMIAEP